MAAEEVKITVAVVSGTLDPTKWHLTSSLDVSHSMFVVSLAAGRIDCVVEERRESRCRRAGTARAVFCRLVVGMRLMLSGRWR